jgi:hypothetical protein
MTVLALEDFLITLGGSSSSDSIAASGIMTLVGVDVAEAFNTGTCGPAGTTVVAAFIGIDTGKP